MATFEENLRKIRGEAVYGSEVRTAIAEAIGQVGDDVGEKIEDLEVIVNEHMFYVSTSKIGTTDDYTMTITEGAGS